MTEERTSQLKEAVAQRKYSEMIERDWRKAKRSG
jgi:hypothetical protein